LSAARSWGASYPSASTPGSGCNLTGPEYVSRFIRSAQNLGVECLLRTTVLKASLDKRILAVNGAEGILDLSAKAVVLAMGCRERTRGALGIPGTRPAGILTAGTAQRLMDVEGYMPGKRVVILGSGDVGLIMARRFAMEGARVLAVVEVMPYPGGLSRNVVQCLDDFGIPLLLEHTVTRIHGGDRLEGVTVAEVDKLRKPVAGTEKTVECDALILSVGLIPENELSRDMGVILDPETGGPIVDENMETSLEGVYACGNVVHVHDLVDHVTASGEIAGRSAARYALGEPPRLKRRLLVKPGANVRYVVPQVISGEAPVTLHLRAKRPERYVAVKVGGELSAFRRAVKPPELVTISLAKRVRGKEGTVRVSITKRSKR